MKVRRQSKENWSIKNLSCISKIFKIHNFAESLITKFVHNLPDKYEPNQAENRNCLHPDEMLWWCASIDFSPARLGWFSWEIIKAKWGKCASEAFFNLRKRLSNASIFFDTSALSAHCARHKAINFSNNFNSTKFLLRFLEFMRCLGWLS